MPRGGVRYSTIVQKTDALSICSAAAKRKRQGQGDWPGFVIGRQWQRF